MDGVTGDALEVRVTRLLGILRLCAVGFELVAIAARPDWYLTPLHLVVPLTAAAWGVVFALGCLRRRQNTSWLAVGEAALGFGLAVGITTAAPPDELAGGPNWVILRLIASGCSLVWFVRRGRWLPYVLLVAGTALVAISRFSDVPLRQAYPPIASVVVVTAIFAVIVARLRAGARTTDAWLATSAERESGIAVATARLKDLRESERVLHDTVLNTLTGLSWGGLDLDDDARARCRRDVARCEQLLGGTEDTDESLFAGLARIVDEARGDGLKVATSVSGEAEVPTDVAVAFVSAIREALSNVRRHAGTRRVRINVRVEAGSAQVDVADDGRGFAPDVVADDRLGIRRSIVERMSDVGGTAEIRSAPGSPTTARLRWAVHPAPTNEPTETVEVKAAYARDAVRAVGGAALLWQAFLGALLVGRWGHYSKPEVMLGIWALTCLALGGCVRAARNVRATPNVATRPNVRAVQDARATPDVQATPAGPAVKYLPNAAVASAVAAVLTGQVLAGVNGTPTDPIPLNWAMSSTYGVVAFLTAAGTPRQLLSASLSFVLGSIAVASAYLADAATVVTYLGAFLYVQAVILLVVGVVGPLRRQTAQATMRAARADAELANRLRATAAVRRDRCDRLRRLRADALPLLGAIGTGQLDPGSSEVRQLCAACATRLRRTLRDGHGTDDLLGGLEAAVRAAEGRGVAVVTQVAGRIDGPPEPARHEVVREVSRVLGRITDGCALLTLTGGADSGSAFVSFTESSAPTSAPDVGRPSASANPGWIEVDEDSDDDDVSVEVRWHAPH